MLNRWRIHMTRVLVAAALLVAAVLLPHAPQIARADSPGDWPMLGHDPGRTSYNADEKTLSPPLQAAWTFNTGCALTAPVVANDTLYLGGSQVYALDARSGGRRWSYGSFGGPTAPVVGDGLLYVTVQGSVYALSASGGALLWHYTPAGGEYISGKVSAASGTIYAVGSAVAYALDALTGKLIWSQGVPGNTASAATAVVVWGTLVYVSAKGNTYALDATTGAVRWSHQGTGAPAIANGTAYVAGAGQLFALDATTGALLWHFDRTANLSAPIADGRKVYVANVDGVYALDDATGSLRWSYYATTGGSTPVLAQGLMYVAGAGKLYALNDADGTLSWSYQMDLANGVYTPPFAAGGSIYVSGASGSVARIWTVTAATGQEIWRYEWDARGLRGVVGGSAVSVWPPAVGEGLAYFAFSEQPVGDELLALDATTGTRRWGYRTGCGVSSSPAVAGGVAYVPSQGGILYGLNAATGGPLWSYDTGGIDLTAPAVADGVAYVGWCTGSGSSAALMVSAFNPAEKAVLWTHDTGLRTPGNTSVWCIPPTVAVDGGTVFASVGRWGNLAGNLQAVDAATGALKWTYGGVSGPPAVAGGTVFAGASQGGKVYALDETTGATTWSYQTEFPGGGGPDYLGPPVATAATVYLMATSGSASRLYALSSASGEIRWSSTLPSYGASLVAVAEGTVYVANGTGSGDVVALDAADGTPKWHSNCGWCGHVSGVANGTAYANQLFAALPHGSHAPGYVYALDTSNGALKWTYQADSDSVSPGILVAAEGMLYVTPGTGSTASLSALGNQASQPPYIRNLSVANVPTKETVQPGEDLSYLIYLDNSGTSGITVTLTDTIPTGTSLVTGTVSGGAVYSPTINSVLWSGTVPPGGSSLPSTVISFRVTIDPDISTTPITNTVLVSDGTVTTTASVATEVWRRTFAPLVFRSYESGW